MRSRPGIACILALACAGCIRTLDGPGRADVRARSLSSAPLRVVYAGAHFDQPPDFVLRLQAALSEEFGRAITIERSPARQTGDDHAWPIGVGAPRPDETTVLIRAREDLQCGLPAAASTFLCLVTLGLFPSGYVSNHDWRTEIHAGDAAAVEPFDLDFRDREWVWLPLLPVMPFSLAWRALRGDAYDAFLRVFPGHLHARLAR